MPPLKMCIDYKLPHKDILNKYYIFYSLTAVCSLKLWPMEPIFSNTKVVFFIAMLHEGEDSFMFLTSA